MGVQNHNPQPENHKNSWRCATSLFWVPAMRSILLRHHLESTHQTPGQPHSTPPPRPYAVHCSTFIVFDDLVHIHTDRQFCWCFHHLRGILMNWRYWWHGFDAGAIGRTHWFELLLVPQEKIQTKLHLKKQQQNNRGGGRTQCINQPLWLTTFHAGK